MQIVEESGSRLTPRRALQARRSAQRRARSAPRSLTPLASLGPVFDIEPFFATPWRRGRRLVDEHGRPVRRRPTSRSDDFYTAFPEGADKEDIASSVVVVRLRRRPACAARGLAGYAARRASSPTRRSARTPAARSRSTGRRSSRRRSRARARLPVPLLDVRPGRPAGRSLSGPPAGSCRCCRSASTAAGYLRAAGHLRRAGRPVVVGRPPEEAEPVIRKARPVPRPAHGHGAAPAQDAPLPLSGPLVVPARRGRALLRSSCSSSRARTSRSSTRTARSRRRLPRRLRAAAGAAA